MSAVRLLRLRNFPILQQLHIEEALLRASSDNWFIVNDGTPDPAVVLGISGKPRELVEGDAALAAGVPLIKRFTGGGTVVVDGDTVFTSLIMHAACVEGVDPFPRPIMRWTEEFFAPAFAPHGDFSLQENDYAFGARKFGGNAQAISRNRWVHHTSLLWDYDADRMALLRQPTRVPDYRRGRDHSEFVTPLRCVMPSRAALVDALVNCVRDAGFTVAPATLHDVDEALLANTIVGTRVLSPEEYVGRHGAEGTNDARDSSAQAAA